MSLAITKENFFWHKVHSITGIIPIGFYMVQHLTLNSFSIGGASKFDSVIGFFDSIPWHLLLLLEIVAIWIPLLFHAVYGLFITGRAEPNYFTSKYKWSQNRMYTLQRYSGVFLFFFLIIHVITTTGVKYATGDSTAIYYAAWHTKLTTMPGALFWLPFYIIGVLAASYHLGYGIWNFCIRWGITITEKAQLRIQKFSLGFFVVITLLGWLALGGFLLNRNGEPVEQAVTPTNVSLPAGTVQ
jgi:succinate dehydrogenase / fumarate reductase cytochrome b subunit